jgi:filaggrin
MGSEENRYTYLSRSTTTFGRKRQEQELRSNVSRGIRRYSQDIDNNQTGGSEARGCHGNGKIGSGSFSLDINTPLYEYVQEQRSYYFE